MTTDSAMPPGQQLYRMAIGHYTSRALHLFAKLAIADLLAEGQRSVKDLAAASDTHEPSLRRVLRLLASAGVVEELANGDFQLTALGEPLRSGPGSSRSSVMLFAGVGIQDAWKDLEYCVRTGQPAFRKYSAEADAFSSMDEEQRQVFDEAMAAFTLQAGFAVGAAYDFSPFASIVDVGGGNGALLKGILETHPGLRGVVFDRPPVIEGARAAIATAGLQKRCRAVGGDFFESVPAGADAYILKHVVHDWDDEQAAAILRNCREAMAPDGKLLIAEGLYPERIDQSVTARGAAANDVNMLVVTGGRQRSESEFKSLYEAAGFTLTRILPTPAGLSLIEGVPA
jgi:SAM-dependent methyltransferase